MRFLLFGIMAWGLLSRLAFSQSFSNEDIGFFEQKVRPLLLNKCFECHSQQAGKDNGGLRLDSRQAILKGGDNGPAAVEARPEQSLLVRAVHYKEPRIEMPPDGKLSEREISVLEEWVRKGLPYPSGSNVEASKRKIDIEAGRLHWAFRPLGDFKPPTELPEDSLAWASGRIDSFIGKNQIENGVQRSSPAPKATLLRRAKFDLIGLPPTVEEMEAFLADTSPDAFDQRIQEWLASPRYGERWARPWLELVRYCDIAESWAETQGNSYLYRDWVINALNADTPFDRFATFQIAADQMADANPSDLAALGFIGVSPTYWKELQLPVEIIKSIVSDEYEERIHTLSSTFLGLNMACARCHDHKFDPITTEDYYGLAGVFASTRAADRALEPGIDSMKVYQAHETVKKLEAELKKTNAEIKKLMAKKGDVEPSEENRKAADAKQLDLEKIEQNVLAAKSTPGFDSPLAPGAFDATLEVKAAIGTHGSRIVYNESPHESAVEIRGDPNKLGAVIPRRFVSVLSRSEPKLFAKGSGRLELAQAITQECEALVARVIVNRIWRLHMGTGIVETTSDFGTQGSPPTHPELLDDLASRFLQQGWSLKWLHREILLSATYQQASKPDVPSDPTNRHYTTAPIRRLEVEAWRDALLQATDSLDNTVGGKPIELNLSTNHRRTIYGTVKRRELSDMLRLYDFPDPITHSPNRIATNTPLQQLFTLNSPFMQELSARFVSRLERQAGTDNAKRIELAYRILFGRPASPSEVELGLAYVQSSRIEDWQQYAQVLLGSNEFLYVD
jgi:hypothetical protein